MVSKNLVSYKEATGHKSEKPIILPGSKDSGWSGTPEEQGSGIQDSGAGKTTWRFPDWISWQNQSL